VEQSAEEVAPLDLGRVEAATEDQQPVKALSARAADPAFGVGVRVRRLDRRSDDLDAFTEFPYAWNCHCSRCRAATGSAFKALAGIERDKLERPAWGPGSHQVTRAQLHDALGHVDADVPAEPVRDIQPIGAPATPGGAPGGGPGGG
jgi:hypothetical protein